MESKPSQEYIAILKKYFGHNEFRPMQWEIIRSIIEDRRDNCVVMATGYGKSICYQFPPVYTNGLGFVVSPLISLMQDQVLSLKVCNIPACVLGSSQTSKTTTMDGILNNEYRLVYVTPEWCATEDGKMLLTLISKKLKVTLVAIDEAHCVSQWGMDFRKSYRNLGVLRDYLPSVPFLTVTATATPQVRNDICASLRLRNPALICTSFDRPNLFLSASIKGDDVVSDIKYFTLKHQINSGSIIIYCPTKKMANKISVELNDGGIKCSTYHADLGLKLRQQVHEDFIRDKISVVVATIAFGMGIDKPDVRAVIHYGAPKEIESYYQEIGRAGRDGLQSYCHVFFSNADFTVNKNLLMTALSGKFRDHKEEMARILEKYLQTSHCRRKLLISHFDSKTKFMPNKKCCDNCLMQGSIKSTFISEYDLTDDAVLILKGVHALNGNYGLATTIFLIRGSTNKRLPKNYYNHELYGKGDSKPEIWWKCLGKMMLREGLLEEKASNFGKGWNKNKFPVSCLHVSSKGFKYAESEGKMSNINLELTPEMLKVIKNPTIRVSNNVESSTSANTESFDTQPKPGQNDLYEKLIATRAELANKLNCVPYMICNNKVLLDLSVKKPKNMDELKQVEGLTEMKVERFGEEFINCIVNVIKEKEIKSVPKVKKFVKQTLAHKSSSETVLPKPAECDTLEELNETKSESVQNVMDNITENDAIFSTIGEDSLEVLEDIVNKNDPEKEVVSAVSKKTTEDLWESDSDDSFFTCIDEDDLTRNLESNAKNEIDTEKLFINNPVNSNNLFKETTSHAKNTSNKRKMNFEQDSDEDNTKIEKKLITSNKPFNHKEKKKLLKHKLCI